MKYLYLFLCFSALILSCSKTPSSNDNNLQDSTKLSNSTSSLQLLISMGNTRDKRATNSDEISIVITQLENLILDTSIIINANLFTVELDNLPAGKELTVSVWGENSDIIVHTSEDTTVTLSSEKSTNLPFLLSPICGSIIAEIVNIPTDIDSINISFLSDSGSYSQTVKRSSKTVLSLDYIPFGATGTVSLVCYKGEEKLHSWSQSNFIFSSESKTIEIPLLVEGNLQLSIIGKSAPTTVITASLDSKNKILDEKSSSLIITEFCATGGSSHDAKEFIELWNGDIVAHTYKDLKVKVGTKIISLPNTTIESKGYYVIGTELANQVWDCDTTFYFDMTSNSGYIEILDGDITLDYLIYFNDYTKAGWEKLSASSKTSWELAITTLNPELNNYGYNWKSSKVLFFTDKEGNEYYGTSKKGYGVE